MVITTGNEQQVVSTGVSVSKEKYTKTPQFCVLTDSETSVTAGGKVAYSRYKVKQVSVGINAIKTQKANKALEGLR